MPKPIKEWFDGVIDSYTEWLAAVRTPTIVARRILNLPDRRDRIRAATALWFAAAVLSLIILLPVYAGFGLSLANVSYHVSIVLTQYLVLAAFASLLHLSLRLYRVPSRATDTFIMYAVASAAVGPLISLVSVAAVRRALFFVRAAKKRELGFVDSVVAMWNGLSTPSTDASAVIAAACDPLFIGLGMIGSAVFVKLAVERYKTPPSRVVAATAFGAVVLSPLPLGVVVLLVYALYFAFVSVS